MQIKTTYFGSTVYTKENGADFDERELKLNQIVSKCSAMIFEGLDKIKLDKALTLLNNLEVLDQIARKEIMTAYNAGEPAICDFVNEHFNEYGEETTQKIFDKLGINKQKDVTFLENLELGLVVAYEEMSRGICATLDYNLIWINGSTFTDQILAVSFNDKMRFLSIAHES